MSFKVVNKAREGKTYTLEDALAHAQRLVASKERSKTDMNDRLIREGYSQDISDEVVSRCQRCGLIDDSRFAEEFANRKIASGWGRERIERELKRHGIEPSEIERALDCLEPTLEAERALSLLERRTISAKSPYQSSMRHLMYKGFSFEIAKKAVEAYLKTYNDM